jgi:hypothetical protein
VLRERILVTLKVYQWLYNQHHPKKRVLPKNSVIFGINLNMMVKKLNSLRNMKITLMDFFR